MIKNFAPIPAIIALSCRMCRIPYKSRATHCFMINLNIKYFAMPAYLLYNKIGYMLFV